MAQGALVSGAGTTGEHPGDEAGAGGRAMAPAVPAERQAVGRPGGTPIAAGPGGCSVAYAALRKSCRRPRIVGITQARMNSTRLPGKVLLPAAGQSLLGHHLERLQRSRLLDQVVVATTARTEDDAVAREAAAHGVAVFRGAETDVLDRFVQAGRAHGADIVVRVTADCPLIDPDLVDRVTAAFLGRISTLDFAGLNVDRYPRGLDTEVTSLALLQQAAEEAVETADREHVTRFIIRNVARFPRFTVGAGGRGGGLRLCVDEAADYALVRRILEALLPVRRAFTWCDVLDLLDRHPDWAALNRGVAQRVG